MMDWRCPSCLTLNRENEDKCAACDVRRETKSTAASANVVISFGAGPTLTPSFGGDPATIPSTPATSIFAKPKPSEGKPPAAAFNDIRATFGCSGGITFGNLSASPTMPATPNECDFCDAMASPPKNTPLLAEGAPDELGDRNTVLPLPTGPGQVFTWGSGECDQLAVNRQNLDETNCRSRPIVIKCFTEPNVDDIATGSLTSYALHINGQVFSWGCADNGALGRPVRGVSDKGAFGDMSPPRGSKVPAPVVGIDGRVVKISAGDSHGAALTEEGEVFCWGHYRDNSGPLGFWDPATTSIVPVQMRPSKVEIPGIVIDICSGDNHTVALTELPDGAGRAICVWGSSEFGQCGQPPPPDIEDRSIYLRPKLFMARHLDWHQGHANPASGGSDLVTGRSLPHPSAALIQRDAQILHLFCGKNTTFIHLVGSNGVALLFGMGRNPYGEVGVGYTSENIIIPTQVRLPSIVSLTEVQGGDSFTAALTADGTVWTWGLRELTGLGSAANAEKIVLEPTPIPALRNRVTSIGAGSCTGYATTFGGHMVAWGDGQQYQIGNGDDPEEPVLTPIVIEAPNFGPLGYVRKICGGAQHGIALVYQAPLQVGAKRRAKEIEPETEAPAVAPKKSRTATGQLDKYPSLTGKPQLAPFPTFKDRAPKKPAGLFHLPIPHTLPIYRPEKSSEQSQRSRPIDFKPNKPTSRAGGTSVSSSASPTTPKFTLPPFPVANFLTRKFSADTPSVDGKSSPIGLSNDKAAKDSLGLEDNSLHLTSDDEPMPMMASQPDPGHDQQRKKSSADESPMSMMATQRDPEPEQRRKQSSEEPMRTMSQSQTKSRKLPHGKQTSADEPMMATQRDPGHVPQRKQSSEDELMRASQQVPGHDQHRKQSADDEPPMEMMATQRDGHHLKHSSADESMMASQQVPGHGRQSSVDEPLMDMTPTDLDLGHVPYWKPPSIDESMLASQLLTAHGHRRKKSSADESMMPRRASQRDREPEHRRKRSSETRTFITMAPSQIKMKTLRSPKHSSDDEKTSTQRDSAHGHRRTQSSDDDAKNFPFPKTLSDDEPLLDLVPLAQPEPILLPVRIQQTVYTDEYYDDDDYDDDDNGQELRPESSQGDEADESVEGSKQRADTKAKTKSKAKVRAKSKSKAKTKAKAKDEEVAKTKAKGKDEEVAKAKGKAKDEELPKTKAKAKDEELAKAKAKAKAKDDEAAKAKAKAKDGEVSGTKRAPITRGASKLTPRPSAEADQPEKKEVAKRKAAEKRLGKAPSNVAVRKEVKRKSDDVVASPKKRSTRSARVEAPPTPAQPKKAPKAEPKRKAATAATTAAAAAAAAAEEPKTAQPKATSKRRARSKGD